MKTIVVPEYVLKSIENTLRRWANINECYKKETCLDRDTIGDLNCLDKIFKGEELTGLERLEDYRC